MMSQKLPLSYIELSKGNLIHNIKTLKSFALKGTKVAVAVKGNAYGHGQHEVVKILEPYVDYFQVDGIEELELLRTVSQKKTLVLGYVQKDDLPKAIRNKCILTFYSLEQLVNINEYASRAKLKQEVHMPIDAELGREGFLESEYEEVFKEIKNLKWIKLSGIYAHFANIEDTNNFSYAKKQIKKFEKAMGLAIKYGFRNLQTHISATSGLLVYEKSKGVHPLLRLGIGVYGMWPSEHIKFLYKNKINLLPVLSWKTKVAQIKLIPAGHSIGYGLTYLTQISTQIALIPEGYADGLSRNLSNKGEVLIHGTRCKVLGRIAMNMFVVNVTHLEELKLEDEVVILGKQGNEFISAEEMADLAGTINYEITTKISAILPRIAV